MSAENNLNPEQQLAALAQAQADMDRAVGYGSRLLGWYSIIVSLVIGALAFLLQLYPPQKHMVGFAVIVGLYVVAILVATLAYRRLYRSLPVGASKRYGWGFALTIAFYAASLALLPQQLSSWVILGLIWIVVSAPLLIVGIGMVRK